LIFRCRFLLPLLLFSQQVADFAYEFEYGDQPLSLQDELNMSEQVDVEQPLGTSHFRQIFSKIFNLLKSAHADETVT